MHAYYYFTTYRGYHPPYLYVGRFPCPICPQQDNRHHHTVRKRVALETKKDLVESFRPILYCLVCTLLSLLSNENLSGGGVCYLTCSMYSSSILVKSEAFGCAKNKGGNMQSVHAGHSSLRTWCSSGVDAYIFI